MNDNVKVVEIKNNEIIVVPLLTGTCINCQKAGCAKQGKPFSVSNPHSLPLSVGSIVKIQANIFSKVFQGFIALILPLAIAVAGYFVGGFLSKNMGNDQKELFRATGVLIGLIFSSGIVFTVNLKSRKLRKCEVCGIVQ
ncbi:MAG: SoxR reducing system RseC family protein [Treponemataceae bacterium]